MLTSEVTPVNVNYNWLTSDALYLIDQYINSYLFCFGVCRLTNFLDMADHRYVLGNVDVMAKVKIDGHIFGLQFNQYVNFPFYGNQSFFSWDIPNWLFVAASWSSGRVQDSRLESRSNPEFNTLRCVCSLCAWARHFTLHHFSRSRCKWVPMRADL